MIGRQGETEARMSQLLTRKRKRRKRRNSKMMTSALPRTPL
jgi:hypothetical protein